MLCGDVPWLIRTPSVNRRPSIELAGVHVQSIALRGSQDGLNLVLVCYKIRLLVSLSS